MTRRAGLPAVFLIALALVVPSTAFALLILPEGEVSEPTLTIEVQPSGFGKVIGPGIDCEDKCSYEIEGSVTLTAVANPGYTFRSWKRCDTGGVNGRQCTITAQGQSIAATFVRTPSLSVSKSEGSGFGKVSSLYGVSCLANCTSTQTVFLEGTEVTVKEAPARHSHFVEWLGDCTGSGACKILMDKDHEVEALFAQDPQHTLTLTKVGLDFGSVKSHPTGIACLYTCTATKAVFYEGETVTLEAIPSKGSTFYGWTDENCTGTGTCTVEMSEAKEAVAQFGPLPSPLSEGIILPDP